MSQIARVGTYHWRMVGWGIPLLLLAVPLIAQFPWTLGDYLFMAVLFGVAGALIELGIRASAGNTAYRLAAGVSVLAGFLLVWVNGAVGLLGDEGNPANLLFAGVLLSAVMGAVGAGLRPAGMARAMFVTAFLQVAAAVIGLAAGWASPGVAGIYEVVLGSTLFGGLWLLAGSLFRKAHLEIVTAARS